MWKLIRSLLFLLSPEFTHDLAKFFMLTHYRLSFFKRTFPARSASGTPNFLGALNPIGLAAGFDKNAEILEALAHFGFGYAEIGTVTPRPQGGNDRPRLFRIPKDRNLFNRMGFNNLGAGVISERVRKIKPRLAPDFKVGVNLGKNKSTSDSDAHLDYAKVAAAFLDTADYFVINVSSPNTPGLRALQTPEFLVPIVKAVQEVVAAEKGKIPIFVKLAPEVECETLEILIRALENAKIDGIMLTNTLAGTFRYEEKDYAGGFSGQILSSLSYARLQDARKLTALPLISVGGIGSIEDIESRMNAGASLIQIYSAWIFNGPFFIRSLVRQLKK